MSEEELIRHLETRWCNKSEEEKKAERRAFRKEKQRVRNKKRKKAQKARKGAQESEELRGNLSRDPKGSQKKKAASFQTVGNQKNGKLELSKESLGPTRESTLKRLRGMVVEGATSSFDGLTRNQKKLGQYCAQHKACAEKSAMGFYHCIEGGLHLVRDSNYFWYLFQERLDVSKLTETFNDIDKKGTVSSGRTGLFVYGLVPQVRGYLFAGHAGEGRYAFTNPLAVVGEDELPDVKLSQANHAQSHIKPKM